jgi:NAD(P)-dependent dehydrogenase (short-subunit alcohol dehydrogenase family)
MTRLPTAPLAGRSGLVLGVERPAGRRAAVALAEAGADVAVVTLSEETAAEFAANSTANEFWAIGRKGIALTSDGHETAVREAIADATKELGPISIVVWHKTAPLPRGVLEGLRSDPAIIVLIGGDDTPEDATALLSWTRELADSGLRANALVADRATVNTVSPVLKEHQPPDTPDVAAAAVYLASDSSAAVEGAVVVAAG